MPWGEGNEMGSKFPKNRGCHRGFGLFPLGIAALCLLASCAPYPPVSLDVTAGKVEPLVRHPAKTVKQPLLIYLPESVEEPLTIKRKDADPGDPDVAYHLTGFRAAFVELFRKAYGQNFARVAEAKARTDPTAVTLAFDYYRLQVERDLVVVETALALRVGEFEVKTDQWKAPLGIALGSGNLQKILDAHFLDLIARLEKDFFNPRAYRLMEQ